MNYSQSLTYLNSFLNLERITFHSNNRMMNLDRMHYLLGLFEHPEKDFFRVLIAGTKGKGSTGFFLESILKESGIAVGFYSSPHLEGPRERIRLNGKNVSEKVWNEGVSEIQKKLKSSKTPSHLGDFTYFEILTLLSVLVFKRAGIQIGIFEVGMGGRLDATNALSAPLVILTPIHMDHEAVLGHTLQKIAYEKAAVIRSRSDVVVTPQMRPAMHVIQQKIKTQKAAASSIVPVTVKLGLAGDFQKINAGAALRAARILKNKHKYAVTNSAIARGLKDPHWPGRLEFFPGKPDLLIDGAHNPASAEALARNLKRLYPNREKILIFATSRDKRSAPMLKSLARYFSKIIVTRNPNPRSQELSNLLFEARQDFSSIYPVGKIEDTLRLAKKLVPSKGLVVATGSFYLIGKVRSLIKNAKHK
jgi:dihydrofolate synthase / folylpolyglutamate synthase